MPNENDILFHPEAADEYANSYAWYCGKVRHVARPLIGQPNEVKIRHENGRCCLSIVNDIMSISHFGAPK